MIVSIVITAYNKESSLPKAVESAATQSWGDVEVIIVEDKSTDGTRAVALDLVDRYSNVRLLLMGENVGAGMARRRGIKVAKGDYILLLDGDDWLENNFIEALAYRAINEDADIVTGGISVHAPDGTIHTLDYGDKTLTGDDKVVGYFGQTTLFLNNRLVRRSLYDKVAYSHRRYIEDVQTCVMLLWHANKNCFVPHCGYHYEHNPNSLTHTADEFKTHLFKTLCLTDMVKFFAKHDRRYLDLYPFEETYKIGLSKIAACNPTEEMVRPYIKEWNELKQFAES